MIRLHQTFGAHTGRSYSFDQPVVRLGRMPDSDVAFDAHADLDASGRHAEVRLEGAEWVVVDAGSRNGTFVGGQRITRHPLRDGDEIECGPGGPRLRVELVDARRAPSYPAPPVRPDAATMAATPVGDAPTLGLPGTVPPPAGPPPSVPPPAAPGFSQPKLYGRQTVGLMIEEAVGRARESETVPGRRLLIGVVVGLAAVLAIMLVVLLVLVLGSRRAGPDPAHVTAANAAALYRVVRLPSEETLCTAFAIRRRVLATTATCVLAIEASRDGGVELRGPTVVRPRQLWRHPAHVQGQLGPDVGLLELDQDVPAVVTLTTPDGDSSVRRGHDLLAFGFAGTLARTVPVEVDEIDVRSDGTRLLRYAESAPDGSPLFDTNGSVVGVHVAGEQAFSVGAETILALLAGLPTPTP